jgi:hypothetical protein
MALPAAGTSADMSPRRGAASSDTSVTGLSFMVLCFAPVESERRNRRGWDSGPARRDEFPAKHDPAEWVRMTAGSRSLVRQRVTGPRPRPCPRRP